MFSCTACTLRCFRAAFGDVFDLEASRSSQARRKAQAASARRLAPWLARTYAAASVSPVQNHLTKEGNGAVATAGSRQRHGNKSDWNALKRAPISDEHIDVFRDPTQRALEKEQRFLKDPLKLAERTVSILHKGETETALKLVQLSSRSMECTVSWNHLMDYEMVKGRATNAMKIYNDVLGFLVHELCELSLV